VALQGRIRLVGLFLSMILAFGIAPSIADDLGSGRPQPTPPLYVTENHGLMASFPPGLTYCPLPQDWVGSDHGTEVYLVPPAACGSSAGYQSSDRFPASPVPTIGLYYAFNVVEIEHKSGQFSPPRTSREVLALYCTEPHTRVPVVIQLLGVPAVGCLIEHGRSVEVRVLGVYSAARAADGLPDHILIVSLATTKDRLSDDLRVFKAVAGSIHVCTPHGAPDVTGQRPCPPGVTWW
jgi:hypothetical protein